MPAVTSVESFVELVQRSRLLTAQQTEQALQELSDEGTEVESPQALADALIDRGLLTSWQAGYLLRGKHNGFFIGSYRFLKMLGKGGMGAVYLAEHERMRRRCAIKVLPTKLVSDGSSVLDRFYLEAQAVAALDDPNIVRAYDVNMEMQGKREIHYLVMEYVEGSDLQVKVGNEGPLDFLQVADFARQAASGLAHAHECGLIHRDIKPANLLIDEKGTVKILDLGLARFFDEGLDASLTTTHNESILGTADYLSPEQALDSHNVDTRTDIYSLGCTCYFMLTGHPPFPDGSVAQRLMSHQVKSPVAIEKERPETPTDLVTIVERMIAKSPDDRYQTAEDVVAAFGGWLGKHADEDWIETHRVMDNSSSPARREPTRAKSAATEDTDLELDFAPIDDGPPEKEASAPAKAPSHPPAPTAPGGAAEPELEQLEPLQPTAPAANTLDPSASTGGLEDLLTEDLDNFPGLDSSTTLGATPLATPLGSGIRKAPQKPPPKKQSKVILIASAAGAAVVVVLLIAFFVFSSSDEPVVAEVDVQSPGPASQSGGPASEPGAPDRGDDVTPATPADVDPATPDRPAPVEPTPPPEVPQDTTPATAPIDPPQLGPPDPGSSSPGGSDTTPPAADPPAAATPPPAVAPPVASPPVAAAPSDPPPPKERNPPQAESSGRDSQNKGRPADATSESQPPSPEKIERLLAGLSEVTIKLDREPRGSYDLMVLKTAQESLERAGLKTNADSSDAAALLTISFGFEKAGADVIFNVSAGLTCRDEEAHEVSVWKDEQVVLQIRNNQLRKTPPKVLRDKVSDFYGPLIKEYRQAVAAARRP